MKFNYCIILIMYFFKSVNGAFVNKWTKNSWRHKKIHQIPKYSDLDKLEKVENDLNKMVPLVFSGECNNLKETLAKVENGQGFLLMGGDCSESFEEFSVNKIRDSYKLILQMGMILTYGSGLPTLKIGRIAGQFAKPRSEEYEIINGTSQLTYRGDIINDLLIREPDPTRMLQAYYQSAQTLNIIRAFSSGGFADINRIHSWNLDFAEKTIEGSNYRQLADKVTSSLNFIKGLGINTNSLDFKQTNFYTSHECLLLNYEEALTRVDSITNKYFDCSAHMVWLGERTRQLDSAHVEFLRGINNPIGIKISHKITVEELLELIVTLNPSNIPGKIVLITRMGAENIKLYLPNLIRGVQRDSLNVVWCCDPMHANTIKTINGIKTRNFDSIKEEVITFFDVHRKMGTYPGGLHLELTGQNVTECIGGNIDSINEQDLTERYLSYCDPRLNCMQALELAFIVSDLLAKN